MKITRTLSSTPIKLPKEYVNRDYGGHTRGGFMPSSGSTGGYVPSIEVIRESKDNQYVFHEGSLVYFGEEIVVYTPPS